MSEGQRATLEALAKSRTGPVRIVQRAQVLIRAADGMANARIAEATGVTADTVRAWRERFSAQGLAEFGRVGAGRGRKPTIPAATVDAIVQATLHDTPPGRMHWSCRTMAKAQGVSPATVQRIWFARRLAPHRVQTFKLSTDRRFEETLVDVVGCYLNPPDTAVVLCMDEKSRIHALDRTQPTLPMKPGRAGTLPHDDKRKGTTTLFAALNVLTGTVIGEGMPQHPHTQFLRFLRRIDREVPRGLAIHLILDHYGTHTHPNVTAWLTTHPRFHLHFTPTSSSWLNLVERWFRNLTEQAVHRGVFPSVPHLVGAIEAYLTATHAAPTPFVWTATAEAILAKVRRGRVALRQAEKQD